MRRWFLAGALVMLLAPRPAAADFGFTLALPGFGLFVGEGGPPPVVYAPPPVLYAPPPVVYAPPPVAYGPPPVMYVPPPRVVYGRPVVVHPYYAPRGKPGRRVGWAKHHRHAYGR